MIPIKVDNILHHPSEIDALLTESSIGFTRSIDRFSPDTMATTASARAAIGAPQLKAIWFTILAIHFSLKRFRIVECLISSSK
ncbi:hypothetical protein PV328_012245 [Microctonus aethiopoides]|uniref:Uncharacterized protein n=1 Tax=Microctonus aethiopoides TaxID=144406 RepID=A0AA39FGS0_9HYME|nr:hypothetical protein PV328_012245 [Microctonus aethiopoides]